MDDLKMKLTKKEAGKNRKLKELEYHNYLYYIKNSPEISDYEFDSMRPRKRLEAEFPTS
jgi:DNA ligase (NAD+)